MMALFRQYYNEISNTSQVKKAGAAGAAPACPLIPAVVNAELPPPIPHGIQRLPESHDGLDMFRHAA